MYNVYNLVLFWHNAYKFESCTLLIIIIKIHKLIICYKLTKKMFHISYFFIQNVKLLQNKSENESHLKLFPAFLK